MPPLRDDSLPQTRGSYRRYGGYGYAACTYRVVDQLPRSLHLNQCHSYAAESLPHARRFLKHSAEEWFGVACQETYNSITNRTQIW